MYRLLTIILILCFCSFAFAAEKVIFSFEKDTEGWEIPDWALEKEDHVGESIAVSSKYTSEGKSSLELMADFPGGIWSAAYVEIQEYFDWKPYSVLSLDVYLPETAPTGLKARLILTQGENWEWIEGARAIALEPGKWTTISGNLKPGSTDWRRTQPTEAFREDVRKLGVRIESNMKPAYTGPIYIDNVRLSE